MDDVRAVMDAVGSESAVLWTGATSTGIGVLFAATYPERCAGLVLFDPRVKGVRSADYPWAPTEEEWRERLADVRAGWGERGFLEDLAREWAPEVAEDDGFRDWFVWHMRRSLSPGAALTSFRAAMELDVRDVLAAVRVPTLVIRAPARPGPGHYTAERIRGSRGRRAAGAPRRVHLGRRRRASSDDGGDEAVRLALSARRVEPERVLATVLFTDIVGSTELAARLGDSAWRELLQRHHADRSSRARPLPGPRAGHGRRRLLRRLRRARARGPGRLGDPRRASAHSTSRSELASIPASARSATARSPASPCPSAPASSSLAAPGEVLVSSTVKDLVAGSGLSFETAASTSSKASRSLAPVRADCLS